MAEQDVLEAALAEISALQQAHWPAGIPRAVEYPLEGGGLVDYLRHWAIERPDTPAIVFYGRVITYSEYDELSDRFAGWLLSLGVERGDRVGVHLVNCPQFHIAMLGILKVGAVHVPINPLFREHELIHELNDAGVKVLLTQNTFSKLVKKVRSQTPLEHVAKTAVSDMLTAIPTVELPFEVDDPRLSDWQSIITSERATPVATELDSLAALNYTGGTTGMPKGCEHTQRHMVYTAATATLAGGDQVGAIRRCPWCSCRSSGSQVRTSASCSARQRRNRGPAESLGCGDHARRCRGLRRDLAGRNCRQLRRTDGHARIAERNLSTLQNVMAVSFVLKLDPATRQRWREATGGVCAKRATA